MISSKQHIIALYSLLTCVFLKGCFETDAINRSISNVDSAQLANSHDAQSGIKEAKSIAYASANRIDDVESDLKRKFISVGDIIYLHGCETDYYGDKRCRLVK